MTTLPAVASNFYVFCKKCDTDRYFKVITHVTSTKAKLKCEVCKCSKTYNLGEESKPAAGAKKAVSTAAKVSKAASHWTMIKDQYKGGQPIDYVISHKFSEKDSVNHPTFGIGYITKTHAHKIEVVFSEGTKELLHGRK